MFIRGAHIDGVMKMFPEVARYQAIVTREQHQDQLRYVVELTPEASSDGLAEKLAAALVAQVKVRGEVDIVAVDGIVQGAKKIDDRRVWK